MNDQVEYRNTTDKGNVEAIRMRITETPHSPAGKFHAQLASVIRGKGEQVTAGKYFPDRAAAEAQVGTWVQAAERNKDLVKV